MITQLDRSLLRSRVRDFNFGAVQQVASLIHSGVLALAAVVLLDILLAEQDRVLRLVLWLNSLAIVFLTFGAMFFNSIIAGPRGPALVLLTLLIGTVEFLLFVVLTPRAGLEDGWRWWYLVYLLLNVVSLVTIHQTLVRWRGDFIAEDVKPLDLIARGWTSADRRGQAILSGLSAAMLAFVLLSDGDAPWRFAVLYAFSAILFGLMFVGFTTMNARFTQIMALIDNDKIDSPARAGGSNSGDAVIAASGQPPS